jgi:hypothetical protein
VDVGVNIILFKLIDCVFITHTVLHLFEGVNSTSQGRYPVLYFILYLVSCILYLASCILYLVSCISYLEVGVEPTAPCGDSATIDCVQLEQTLPLRTPGGFCQQPAAQRYCLKYCHLCPGTVSNTMSRYCLYY